MVVVGIIALLVVMALPSFVKARKQSQGRRAINEVRILDGAGDQWAMEHGKKDGDAIAWGEAVSYVKQGMKISVFDPLGNRYVGGVVGSNQITISTITKSALAGVGIDWGIY